MRWLGKFVVLAWICAPGLSWAQTLAYDVFDKSLSATKAMRLFLPRGMPARGIVLMANAAGGDSRDWAVQSNNSSYIELANRLQFGMLGTVGMSNDVATTEGPLVMAFLEETATSAERPELRNVPFIATGFSAGGQFAYEWNAWKPERTIAFNVDKGGFYRTLVVSEAALKTPGVIVSGADDTVVRRTNIKRLFTNNRPRGARWAFYEQYAYPHNPGGTQHLFAPFFGRVAAYRYPSTADASKGPVVLRDLPESMGWLANNASWALGFTAIASFGEYTQDRTMASWLPDEDLAFVYRAFSSFLPSEPTLPIEARRAAAYAFSLSTSARVVAENAAFDFRADMKTFDWKKVEFFAGARKLGEALRGGTPSVRVQLPAGEYGLSAVATGAAGEMRTAKPIHLHVKGIEPPRVILEGFSSPPPAATGGSGGGPMGGGGGAGGFAEASGGQAGAMVDMPMPEQPGRDDEGAGGSGGVDEKEGATAERRGCAMSCPGRSHTGSLTLFGGGVLYAGWRWGRARRFLR